MTGERQRKRIPAEDAGVMASAGMDFSEKSRSATFMQQDGRAEFARSMYEGVEIMDMRDALAKDPDAQKYYGRAFREAGKDFPQDTEGGYFIKVKKGADVQLPIQACLYLKSQGFRQKVHNVVIVEEGARAFLITGCSSSHAASEGSHLGLSEFFLKKGAFLNFTMIHSWREDTSVRPMSVIVQEEGSQLVSNYICLRPVRDVVMYPTAFLARKARASFNSLILSHPGSLHDVGSRVVLRGDGAEAEIVSRSVSLGGRVTQRGHIKAEAENVKGHLECRGLILSPKGYIYAIPEMETEYRDVNLSHEAAIGRISREEIEYLASRGLSRAQAQSVIVRGFMDVGILGLPGPLREEMDRLEEKTLQADL
jgi:Fe-S cluster assembly scaffold protein SufB